MLEQTHQLGVANEPEAIGAALNIMELTYEKKVHLVPGLVDGLLARLTGSAPMSYAAAWALSWLNSNGAWQPTTMELECLITFVSDVNAESEAVRWLSWVLGEERVVRAFEPIVAWLDNPNTGLRSTVANTLGRIGGERAVEPLLAHLADPEVEVRQAVAGALGSLKSERAVEPLLACLENPDIST